MSEDKDKEIDDNTNDVVTQKDKEIELLKNEKAAMEMKLRRSDEDLYSEEYLAFLQEQKNKPQQQDNFMSGGRLSDYSADELTNMAVPKLVGLMVGEVNSRLEERENKKMTVAQAKEHKKRVENARLEIKHFAKDHPDFWNFAPRIDELAQENPNLNAKQLYILAGGKVDDKQPDKQEPKPKAPNTRPQNEGGMKKSDYNLSTREIIEQEYKKLI
ncbi:MAG: hypothetical protein IMZ64_10470 [Bacteroidetes bacterium]|nr:hypothetical protein [Bacteroidota bacterium]